jgi:hypothetical protein
MAGKPGRDFLTDKILYGLHQIGHVGLILHD